MQPSEVFSGNHHSGGLLCCRDLLRLLRSLVGPPTDISWDQPWHESLHLWNAKVRQVCEHYSLSDWATTALHQYWKPAAYVGSLPQDQWICRVLNWIPDLGRRNAQGRLQQSWDDRLGASGRWQGLGTWKDTARNFFGLDAAHGCFRAICKYVTSSHSVDMIMHVRSDMWSVPKACSTLFVLFRVHRAS